MTTYETHLKQIETTVFSNREQLNTIINTRRYINTNFDNELTLEALSKTWFISKYHLLRLFKKYYGQTPKQYLMDTRIERSKVFLRTGMTISETCFAVGFETPSSFTTLFKARTGATPTAFQKEQLSQSQFCTAN